jgi:hypothetical protein
MKRTMSSLVIVVLIALVSTCLAARAQDQPATPLLPSGILGPQLIVWSQAQKPQPVPQPLPDPPEQQAKKQPEQPANPQPAEEQAVKRMFTGKIVKDAGHYVLKVSNECVYQLDDEQKAKEYEGKDVRVVGTLDAHGAILRVSDIEVIA